jgi:iron complex outermembrane receptor protein
MNLPGRLEFDTGLYYVDNLPALGVDSYVSLDARLGWRASEDLEFSVVGQSLLDSEHTEFAPSIISVVPTEVEHSVYVKATCRI